jgi:hypothetical protein
MPRWLGFILSRFRQERRAADRLRLPFCPRCHSQQRMHVESRSSYAVYFNCRDCHEMIVLAKPKR